MIVVTAGFMILWSEWPYLGLFAICAGFAWVRSPSLPRDAGWWGFLAFICWLLLRSFVGTWSYGSDEMVRGVVGAVLLVWLVLTVWQRAEDDALWPFIGRVMGVVAAVTAAVSALFSYVILPPGTVGERLTNLFVHGGLNAVCTGLTYGMAAVWLLLSAEGRWQRLIWPAAWMLHYAVFLTRSRGALLALVLAHAVMFFFQRDWRKPLLFMLAGVVWVVPSLLPISHEPEAITSMNEMLHRADSGRMDLYRAAWELWDYRLLGTGQWGVIEQWRTMLRDDPQGYFSHFHSAYLATLIHGGIVAVILLLGVWLLAVKRAWIQAKSGDTLALVLLTYGSMGLVFDGQSLASMATIPRYEALLFWLPVTLALARSPRQEPAAVPA
jgi:O-antigen ligase